jgi:gas vesicle protein
MNENRPSKLIFGFVIGTLAGVVAILFAQYVFKGDNSKEVVKAPVNQEPQAVSDKKNNSNKPPKLSLVDTRPDKGSSSSKSSKDSEGDNKDKENDESNAAWEALKALGDAKDKAEAQKKTEELASRLKLSPAQKEKLEGLLNDKAARNSTAGLKLLTGKATVADMIASDEEDYSQIDEEMRKLLSGEQLEEYETYAEEREVERIEKKTKGDLDGIEGIPGITEEQVREAWDALIEINAKEKPGTMLNENSTREEFIGVIDGALDNRVESMRSILTDDQLGAYQIGIEGFRKFISGMVPEE